jgi:hypothetical protein
MVSDHDRGPGIKEEKMHPVHPAMMAAIAADHIRFLRDDAVRDERARSARRSRRLRRASDRAVVQNRTAGCELIERHA